jgi:hypothetical protein
MNFAKHKPFRALVESAASGDLRHLGIQRGLAGFDRHENWVHIVGMAASEASVPPELQGHKAAETGAVCLGLMVQGQIAQATVSHCPGGDRNRATDGSAITRRHPDPSCASFCQPLDGSHPCGDLRLLRRRRDPRFALPGRVLGSGIDFRGCRRRVGHHFLYPHRPPHRPSG